MFLKSVSLKNLIFSEKFIGSVKNFYILYKFDITLLIVKIKTKGGGWSDPNFDVDLISKSFSCWISCFLFYYNIKKIKYFLSYELLKIGLVWVCMGRKTLKRKKSIFLLLLLHFLSYRFETLQKRVLGNCSKPLGEQIFSIQFFRSLWNFNYIPNNYSCKVLDLQL